MTSVARGRFGAHDEVMLSLPSRHPSRSRLRVIVASALVLAASVVALSLATAGCPTLVARDAGKVPAPEQSAPDFTLKAHTGGTVSLARLAKKGPVVIAFYRGHW